MNIQQITVGNGCFWCTEAINLDVNPDHYASIVDHIQEDITIND